MKYPTFLAMTSIVLCLEGVSLRAQGPGVEYELLEGSQLVDECVFCDRAPIIQPLVGKFLLTQIPSFVCCVYSITEVSFSSDDGRYTLVGEGMYSTSHIGQVSQQMNLELTVNGLAGVDLVSGSRPIEAPEPLIQLTLTESGERDPDHKFTITLVAAPTSKKISYELVEGKGGSYLVDDCGNCERPVAEVPLRGTFLLGQLTDPVNPFGVYAVEDVSFESIGDVLGGPYRITGSGALEYGGEVALTQRMFLLLDVNFDQGNVLASEKGPVPPGVGFPDLEVDLKHSNPKTDLHIYSIHLVARPAGTAKKLFRRGDPNGDEKADISDGVFVLGWLFLGGPAPGCLDAADTNLDGAADLADAVYLLNFLFQGGPAPGAPGPETCGAAERENLGCESSPCTARE